jgi:hypothetical protein
VRHFLLFGLVYSVLWLASNCCLADCGSCGSAACGPCGTAACEPCGTACGPGVSSCKFLYGHCGPPREPCIVTGVRGVFAAFGFHCCGCENGCGEKYWGDWCSDPPDCWDPCDCHGNFVGGCSGPPAYAPGPYGGPVDGWVEGGLPSVAPQAAGTLQTVGSPKVISKTERVAGSVQAPQAAPRVTKASHVMTQSRRVPIRH